jgi:amidase
MKPLARSHALIAETSLGRLAVENGGGQHEESLRNPRREGTHSMLETTRRDFIKTTAAGVACLAAGATSTETAFAADELGSLDATAQAELVRQGKVKAVELVEAAIARIERLNPKVNAVVTKTFDQAIDRAKSGVSGPFAGVPYLIKDLTPNKGVRVTFGSEFFKDNIATFSTEIVKRTEASGLITIGKSNTPEFGLVPITEPKLFGPTRNPWNLELTSGGSSGGAAAAVAAGMVPMAHASDGGGSIRIPASCCGVFGMKITRGRNPDAPNPNPDGLSVQHCVSRSVRDSAALLDATRGPMPGDIWWALPPARPYVDEVKTEPKKLQIAFLTTDYAGGAIHPDCKAAVEQTAKICADLGHHVDEASAPVDGVACRDAFRLLWVGRVGSLLRSAAKTLGRKPDRDMFEPYTWALGDVNDKLTPADARSAHDLLLRTGYQIAEFMKNYDVILTSTMGLPPLRVGELDLEHPSEMANEKIGAFVPYTWIFNVTGQPAMSVPLVWNAAGVPIGSHFVGRFGEEGLLFQLAGQLERAKPWAGKRPQSLG